MHTFNVHHVHRETEIDSEPESESEMETETGMETETETERQKTSGRTDRLTTRRTFNPTPQQMTSVQAQGAAAGSAPAPTPAPTPAPAPALLHDATLMAQTMPVGEFVERMKTSHASPQAAFASMDTDRNGLLGYPEFAAGCAAFQLPLDDNEAGHAFQGFDANKDAHLSQDEFFGVLKIGEFWQTPEAIARMTGQDYDCNEGLGAAEASWTVGKKSWCCAHGGFGCTTTPPPPDAITIQDLLQRLRVQDKSPEAAFRLLDEDGDSFVTKGEFEDGAKACEPPLTEAQAGYAFKGLDSNYDGKVSLVEFTGAVKMGHFFSTLSLEGGHASTTQWTATKDPMTEKVFMARLKDLYIYIYIHIHMHKCIHTYIHICISIYVYTYIHICIYMFLSLPLSLSIYIYIYRYLSLSLSLYTYIYIYVYKYIYIYIYTHAGHLWLGPGGLQGHERRRSRGEVPHARRLREGRGGLQGALM